MSAESIIKQEQLYKDNKIMQQEQERNLTKLCKVDSPNSISSNTFSIDNYVEVTCKCVQMDADTHHNEASCQLDEQISQNLKKAVTIDTGSISEQVCCNDKNDDLFISKNKSSTISQTTIGKDISDSVRPSQVTELSEDYMIQMLNNINDRRIALVEGFFLDADEQNLLPLQEASMSDESEKADKLELIVENNDNTEEKSMVIDSHTERDNEETSIDENKTGKPDLLPSMELLMVDESNSVNDIAEIEKKCNIKNSCDSVKLTDNGNGNQCNIENIPVDKPTNINLKRSFSQCKSKGITPTTESHVIINRIQHMEWLKPTEKETMEMNKRKMARKSSIEKEECNEDIKEELADDTKMNSKKKRSNQRKNLKTKAVDSHKQDAVEDMNKKSSENVGLTDTSKSTNGRAVDKFKNTQASQVPASQRIGIGRGRSDRRKVSLGNSQPKGQIDISDQRNKSHKSPPEDRCLTMVEKSFSKSETHSNSQGPPNKVEKAEDFTENIVVSIDLTKSKEQEVCETKSDSKSHQDVKFSHNQSSVENTEDSSIQENKGKIDKIKDQLPSEDHQQSQNRSATDLSSSRPIYGRSTDKSNSEETLCSVRGFGQNTGEAIKNKKPSQTHSSNNVDRFSEQANRNQHEKMNQSYSSLLKSNEESCSNKYTNSSNTYDKDFPRWNYNNYPEKQNVKRDEMISHQSHTSNKHRIIADEKSENEESLGKNQAFADKSQGSRRYSDKYQDGRTSVGRYSDRNQDNNFHDKHSDKKQDDKNHAERYSNRNEDCKSYRDTNTERSQAGRRDTYFDNNHRNRGFSEKFSDVSQDRHYGSNYSNKFRDGKISSDRYSDNQQSKTSSEKFYNKKHENEMVTKKEEFSNKNPVSFDKNENSSDNNHITTKSSDSSNKNQRFPDKNNESPKSAKVNYGRSHPTNEDVSENDSAKNYQALNQERNNYRNQDTSNIFEFEYHGGKLCPQHQQQKLDQSKNNFWPPPNRMDWNKEKQYQSDVKSQKHFDNTQQVKVQMGLNQVLQSHSMPSVVCQQELSSAVIQNYELHRSTTPLTDMTKSQPSQSETWSSYNNSSKQDAVYSSGLPSASPYADVNISCSPAVMNEYNLQFNETLMDSSNQFNNTLASGHKPNVVMTFDGNQNVQRALGIDPRVVNPVNNNNSSRSNTSSPAPSQPMYTNENVAQFFQSAAADSQTTLKCMHSTMNVNAQPFEVMKQSNQESNKQQMYAMQPTVSNHGQSVCDSLDNNCVVDVATGINEKSNDCEEYLKLRKEIYDLSQQLALRQGQLLALEIKWFKTASGADKTGLYVRNQQSSPPIQHISNNQLVQESNQILPSSYVQVKPPNCPPGFGDVSMDRQSTQLNMYKMLANVANVQNYSSDSLPSNSVSESKSNAQAVYLAQGNVYQQQTATYQMYTDKTANNATYISMMPQRAEQRQIRGVNQFSK